MSSLSDQERWKINLIRILEDSLVRFGINQAQLAARVKVSQGTISQWMRTGSTQFPSEESRKAIATALGMTIQRFECEVKGIPFDPNPSITYTEVADYLAHCNLREFFLLTQDVINPRTLEEIRIALVGTEELSKTPK